MRAATLKRQNARPRASSAKRSVCLAAFFVWASIVDSFCGQSGALIITNLNDGGPGSLRDALATAQSGDTISFAVRGAILLTNGELEISNNLKIAGPGATNLSIRAAGQSRVLEILPGA